MWCDVSLGESLCLTRLTLGAVLCHLCYPPSQLGAWRALQGCNLLLWHPEQPREGANTAPALLLCSHFPLNRCWSGLEPGPGHSAFHAHFVHTACSWMVPRLGYLSASSQADRGQILVLSLTLRSTLTSLLPMYESLSVCLSV